MAREHDLWIVSDEAYEDVLYEPYAHHSVASIAGDWADRVISVFSFSKSHAMSGLRVGYVVTRSAAAAGANSEAASLHDQRREQPGAVGRARRGHRTAGSPRRDARRVHGASRHAARRARRTFRAFGRSRRAVRSTSGRSSIQTLYTRLGVSGADELSSRARGERNRQRAGRCVRRAVRRRDSVRVQL